MKPKGPFNLAVDFIQHISPKESEQNHQSSSLLTQRKCWNEKMKSVNICTSMNDTERATLAVSVCADGTKLPPILIFKGTQKGWVANKEFPQFVTWLQILLHGWTRVQ